MIWEEAGGIELGKNDMEDWWEGGAVMDGSEWKHKWESVKEAEVET